MRGFDPQEFVKYITTMADLEAIKHQSALVELLEKQREKESAVAITASKIAELEKVLAEERKKLTEYAIEAAKYRQHVVNSMLNITPAKQSEENPVGEGPKGPLWT